MKIGELAERTGLAPSAIRYYESLGLIAPARSAGGTRRYRPSDVDRLAAVGALTSLGVPLDRLVKLAGAPRDSATGDEAAHRAVLHLRHLSRTLNRTIERASELLTEIDRAEAALAGCFRCKEKPAADLCAACGKAPDPAAAGRVAELGRA